MPDHGTAIAPSSNERAAQAALEDITRRVRDQSDRIQKALTPMAEGAKSFADASPVIFTFLSIFCALSCIPILCFAGFVIASTVFLTGTGLIILTLSILGTLALASAILLPVLIFSGVVAFMALCVLLSLFLAHRLYIHLLTASEADLPPLQAALQGVRTWLDETAGRIGLSTSLSPKYEPNSYKTLPAREPREHDYSAYAVERVDAKPVLSRHSSSSSVKNYRVVNAVGAAPRSISTSVPQVKAEPDLFSPEPRKFSDLPKQASDADGEDDWESEEGEK